MSEEQNKVTVYYDGACPKCVRDRENYEKLAGKDRCDVVWFDITGKDDELHAIGIDPRKALTELHVKDEKQNIISEIDAYIVLLRKIPLMKPLAWFIGLPLIRPLLSHYYHKQVNERLHRDGRL